MRRDVKNSEASKLSFGVNMTWHLHCLRYNFRLNEGQVAYRGGQLYITPAFVFFSKFA